MASKRAEQAAKKLNKVPATEQRLKRDDFDLTNSTANQRSKIAEYKAESPIALRADGMRLVFTTQETFTSDATAGGAETFTLSNNALDTSNTNSFLLYENGNRVQPDSVDYSANSFTYTDDGTSNDLHAFYVPRDPVELTVEKHAPNAQGGVNEILYEDATSVLHERNQHKKPPEATFNSPLQPVIPRNWTLKVFAEGGIGLDWDDADAASTDGVAATSAMLTLPINRAKQNVEGLGKAVKADVLDRI